MNQQEQIEGNNQHILGKWPHWGLSKEEWREIVALDYVLTWNYTEDLCRDERRYKELSDKKWAGMNNSI